MSLANLPTDEAALAPTAGYTTTYTYKSTGTLATEGDPAEGGLPTETLSFGYDAFGEPTSLASGGTNAWTYVSAIGYSEYGQPLQYTFGPSTSWVALSLRYDEQTGVLTDAKTTDSTSSTVVDDTSYTWGNAAVSKGTGLLTATTDAQNSGATTDTQCYTYDYADRLSSAWTATDNCAAAPAAGASSTVGGPNPYWQSWTYTADGLRKTQTDHDTSGNTANDTTATYNYPTAGSSSDQPHTLTSTSATGPAAAADTASYTYDAAGNTLSISGGAAGAQNLTWNDQGKLATDTTSSGTTSYLYDAAGGLVLRTDPGKATLFVGDAQIVEDTASHTLTATRYYSVAGHTIAERSSTGDIQYLIPNRQGTDTLAIDYQTQSVTRRQYLPFGQTRSGSDGTWPGDIGFVGGTSDPVTSLENLGAREYNPVTGRFLSNDPVFEALDTNQLSGYDYAGNDPVTLSDPTGLDNWWADPTMNKPVTPDAPPISQSLADAQGFGSLCNASNCSNYHAHPVFITPHFGFSANTPNIKQLSQAFARALKTHYDQMFDPRASTYKMPSATLAYGIEVGTWDDVCKGKPDLCSKSFADEVSGLHAALDKQAKANERGVTCIFFGQCHWWKVTAAGAIYFRTMRAGPDGKPMLGNSARTLGGRAADYQDNLDEDGNIVVDEEGATPPGLSTGTNLPKMFRVARPNWLPGGQSKDPVWAIKDSALAERGLAAQADPGDKYHIMLGPDANGVSPDEYNARIQSTQDDWINTQAQSMEDVQAFLAEAESEE